MPTTNHRKRKNISLATLSSICPPSKLWRTAMVLSITIRTMAKISSKMSTLSTSPVNCFLRRPRSSNALYMIVVDDMAIMHPRKRLSILTIPKADPTPTPS